MKEKTSTKIHIHHNILHCPACQNGDECDGVITDTFTIEEPTEGGGDNMSDVLDVNEIARQVAEQTAQQVGEAVSQAISKLLQSQTMTTGMSTTQERMGDIGGTERLEKDSMDNSGILFSNQKRTYDEYQHESLESIKRNRSYVDKILADSHGYDMDARNVANQALQNAVETANMVGKQAVRHGDIAIDRQWNVDEQGYQVDVLISALKPTLESVVAKILADMASNK
jgi:hypothetical protein